MIAAHIVGQEIRTGQIIPVKTLKDNVINKITLVQLQDKVPSLTEKIFVNFLKADIQSSSGDNKFLNIRQK